MPKNTDGTFTLCKHCLLQAVREQCAGRGVCALERAEAKREAMAAVVAQLTYESMINALGGPHA